MVALRCAGLAGVWQFYCVRRAGLQVVCNFIALIYMPVVELTGERLPYLVMRSVYSPCACTNEEGAPGTWVIGFSILCQGLRYRDLSLA